MSDHLEPQTLASALAATPFAHGLHHFPTIESTNTHALQEAKAGAPHGSFYVADEQTAGRGRSDHAWISQAGEGLYLSVLLRPKISTAELTWLPLLAGLAAHRAIREVTALEADLRWPNDLLIGHRKTGGILVEALTESNRVTAAVIGIGINLHQQRFPAGLATEPTSLDMETDRYTSRQDLLIAVLQELSAELQHLDHPESIAAIPNRISAISTWVQGRQVEVHGPQPCTGTTLGLDSSGFLRVQTATGPVTITTGGLRSADWPSPDSAICYAVPMRRHLTLASALFLTTLAPAAYSAPAADLATRLAAQNALFDDSWQATLKLNPTLATAVGDYRYNDQLGDSSLAASEARHQRDLADLAKIKAIDATGFPEQDLISHDLFLRQLQQRVEDYDLKEYEMPLSASGGGGGIHANLADLPLSMPFDSVKHYEDYIARLHQIPKAFLQTEEVLRAGVADHLVPVRFIAEKVPGQAEGVVAANPFFIPLKKFPAGFSEADKKRLTDEITATVNNEVFPAYKQFAAFITSDYIPHCRTTLSVNSLGGGKRRYQATLRRYTTTSLTAAQIHEIGLKEVARITGEMATLAKANGYKDLATFRDHVEADPKYQPVSADAIVEDFRKYIAQMQPRLPELFNLLPKTAVTVEPIPPFQAAAATHYQGGTPDGKRPGRVSVAVSDPTHRSFINDEAVAYHEGVPGHHLQITIQQSLTGLPEFRKHGGNSAYTEGWGLYAEELGKEIGFYQDPGSDYGRLRSELFRAVRLVVDTGIHDMDWSRDQVVDYMRQSHAIDEPTIQSETDRYISGPGQACSYKLGQLKIRELRERAKQQLGPKFDLKTFHDEILSGGALPLDLLEARVNRWIQAQL